VNLCHIEWQIEPDKVKLPLHLKEFRTLPSVKASGGSDSPPLKVLVSQNGMILQAINEWVKRGLTYCCSARVA